MTWHARPDRRDEARLLKDDEIRALFYGPYATEDAEHCARLLNEEEA